MNICMSKLFVCLFVCLFVVIHAHNKYGYHYKNTIYAGKHIVSKEKGQHIDDMICNH